MKYDLYLFDFDYTLADSSRGIVICFRNVLTRHGYTSATDEDIKRTIGKTLEESFSILSGITDGAALANLRKEYEQEANEYMTVNTHFYPETKTVLTALKANNARIGIISTKYRYRIVELLSQHFPTNFFDIIIGGEDVKCAKPSPEGIHKALKRLHARRKEVLYIGDSTVDAEAAQAAKVDFAGVLHGMTTRKELEVYPHNYILPDLSLLPFIDEAHPYHRRPEWLDKPIKYLRFLHWKQMRGFRDFADPQEPCTCKNCGKTFTGLHCNVCGQHRDVKRFTIHSAIRNILGGLTNIDNGFGRNLVDLLYRPGYMISDYLKGKRIAYFKPFPTLFVLAAIYVLFAQFIDPKSLKGEDEERVKAKNLTEIKEEIGYCKSNLSDSIAITHLTQSINHLDSAQTAIERRKKNQVKKAMQTSIAAQEEDSDNDIVDDIVDEFANVFKEIGDTIESKGYLDHNSFAQSVMQLLSNWAHGNKALRAILLLPVLAIATRWAFRRRKINRRYNFPEHLFAQTFIACQILLISILYMPFSHHADVNSLFDFSAWLLLFIYICDFKQLFGGTWMQNIRRTLLTLFYVCILAIAVCFLIVLFFIIIAAIWKLLH